MFCKNCGKQIPNNSKFCTYCGCNVAKKETLQDDVGIKKQENINFLKDEVKVENPKIEDDKIAIQENVSNKFDSKQSKNKVVINGENKNGEDLITKVENNSSNKKIDKKWIVIASVLVVASIAVFCFFKYNNSDTNLEQNLVNAEYESTKAGEWVGNSYYRDGKLVTDEWVDGYYVDSTGEYVRNKWQEINGDWYYFDENGKKLVNTWVDNEYYVNANGIMLKNTTTPDGYFVDSDGKWSPLYGKNNIKTEEQTNIQNAQNTNNINKNKQKLSNEELLDKARELKSLGGKVYIAFQKNGQLMAYTTYYDSNRREDVDYFVRYSFSGSKSLIEVAPVGNNAGLKDASQRYQFTELN